MENGDADRHLVYLTDSGWRIAEAIFSRLRQLQDVWAQEVGRERFDVVLDVLRELAAKAQDDAKR